MFNKYFTLFYDQNIQCQVDGMVNSDIISLVFVLWGKSFSLSRIEFHVMVLVGSFQGPSWCGRRSSFLSLCPGAFHEKVLDFTNVFFTSVKMVTERLSLPTVECEFTYARKKGWNGRMEGGKGYWSSADLEEMKDQPSCCSML